MGKRPEHEHERGDDETEGQPDRRQDLLDVGARPDGPMAGAQRDVAVKALADLVGVLGVTVWTEVNDC